MSQKILIKFPLFSLFTSLSLLTSHHTYTLSLSLSRNTQRTVYDRNHILSNFGKIQTQNLNFFEFFEFRRKHKETNSKKKIQNILKNDDELTKSSSESSSLCSCRYDALLTFTVQLRAALLDRFFQDTRSVRILKSDFTLKSLQQITKSYFIYVHTHLPSSSLTNSHAHSSHYAT